MNLPPPLSATRSSFVTVMAYLSLALGAFGVVTGGLQAVMLASVAPHQQFAASGITLPPALLQLFDHLGLLNLLSLGFSAVFTVVSWGLLQRREWGRLGFIACLVLGAILGLATMWWMTQLMAGMNAMAGADLAAADPVFAGLQSAMKIVLGISAVLVAALHAGIIWKLCTPAIRAEFRH